MFAGAPPAAPLAINAGYRYSLNGMVLRTWDSVGRVNNLGIGLLVAEGCLVCGLAALYEWMLLTQVARQRYGLYSVFLVIPTGFLRALASKHVQVDGEDDNDSDSEAGDDPGKQQAQQAKQQEGDKSGEGDKVGGEQDGLADEGQSLWS